MNDVDGRARARRRRRRSSDVVLDVAGLRAAYGHVPVLHGIDFQLHAGEAVGIVGHNGVGKTTLLKALIGLVPATRRPRSRSTASTSRA